MAAAAVVTLVAQEPAGAQYSSGSRGSAVAGSQNAVDEQGCIVAVTAADQMFPLVLPRKKNEVCSI